MKNTDKAYIAGFLDADGSISIIHHKRSNGSVNYDTKVRITNTYEDTIERIRDMIPYKSVKVYKRDRRQPNYATSYDLVLNSREDIADLLEDIYPYLITKKDRASLMIEYCRSRCNHPKKCYTSNELELRERLCKLNIRLGERKND